MQEVKNVLKGTNGGKCVLIHQNVKYSGEKNLEKVIWVKDDWLYLKLNSQKMDDGSGHTQCINVPKESK